MLSKYEIFGFTDRSLCDVLRRVAAILDDAVETNYELQRSIDEIMAIFDRTYGGYRIFVGDLGSRVGKYELEREFDYYGPIIDVWVAR